MAKKPVEVFKSDEEFQKYAKEWQHRLFLDDWFITYKLSDEILTAEDGTELWGFSAYAFSNSAAQVVIYNGKNCSDGASKNVAELTLVHELLHIKLEYMIDEEIIGQISQLEMSLKHKAVEAMAKSFIMAKYNVPREYFNDTVVFSNDTRTIEVFRGAKK